MKQILATALTVAFLLGVVSIAKADMCEFYQWKMKPCKVKTVEKAKPAAAVKVEKVVLQGVKFDTASAIIRKDAAKILNENIAKLKNKDNKIAVVGYTDDRGSEKLNLKLSDARANSIKDYFIKNGIAADRVSSVGKGAANPVADNKTEVGRAENRRIELELK